MWTLNDNKEWPHLVSKFSWVQDMAGVPQDPIHHAEGDVAIHTQMVLAELLQLPEYLVLPTEQREVLWASALLHDVEKRSTTALEPDGRITSAGHAKKGMFTARQILYREVPTPFYVREQVAKLVRYHGLPIWLFEKPDPKKALVQESLEINTAWLALLAKADMLGRICEDKAEMLYRVELFKELCLEMDCWGKPRAFSTESAKMNYLIKDGAPLDYVPFGEPNFEVVLMSGLPGAGKDTHIKRHYADWPVVSLDALRVQMGIKPTDKHGNGVVVQAAKEKAKNYLRKQQPFVWNATNITKQMREQLIALFLTYGAKVRIDYVEVPYQSLMRQNKNREAIVPTAVLERMIDKLDVPSPNEAHEVRYFV